MRIVFDTSVLIAAHIAKAGVCAQLIEQMLEVPEHSVHASDFILDEFQRKLIDKFGFSAEASRRAAERWKSFSGIVVPAKIAPEVCRDPEDLAVLGTARAARAELLITVDKDLLALRSLQQTKIVRPGEAFPLIR